MKIRDIMDFACKKLNEISIENPAFEVGLLLAHILEKDRSYLYINSDLELEKHFVDKFNVYLNLRLKFTPIQYILNEQVFMGLEFFVDSSVLIPRPDTEILVQEALNYCENIEDTKILEIGTGSGCIAISLAYYLNNTNIVACDISKAAIEIAKKNALKNNVSNRIKFIESDMYGNISEDNFDIIISNPPYIESNEINNLQKEVKLFEPQIALNGGNDGMDFYRIILKGFKKRAKANGKLMLEIGFNQNDKIIKLIEEFKLMYIKTLKDFGQNNRVVIVTNI
ncbi:MAG: peptide chain release factor N(5)-glutamine methyltransferase [Clostridiales bacterium]